MEIRCGKKIVKCIDSFIDKQQCVYVTSVPILPILDVLERRSLGPWSVDQQAHVGQSLNALSNLQMLVCFVTLNKLVKINVAIRVSSVEFMK